MLAKTLIRFAGHQAGATAVEYGLICGIIGAALLAIAGTGGALEAIYESLRAIVDAIIGAGAPAPTPAP